MTSTNLIWLTTAEASRESEIRKSWLRLEDRVTEVMDRVRKEFHLTQPDVEKFKSQWVH